MHGRKNIKSKTFTHIDPRHLFLLFQWRISSNIL